MATTSLSMTSREVNGSAMAAVLGGGIGAFAMGAVVLPNEAGIFAAPALYAPAGGVSGRTTLATVVWLMTWAVLHNRWKAREIAPGPRRRGDPDPDSAGCAGDLSAGLGTAVIATTL